MNEKTRPWKNEWLRDWSKEIAKGPQVVNNGINIFCIQKCKSQIIRRGMKQLNFVRTLNFYAFRSRHFSVSFLFVPRAFDSSFFGPLDWFVNEKLSSVGITYATLFRFSLSFLEKPRSYTTCNNLIYVGIISNHITCIFKMCGTQCCICRNATTSCWYKLYSSFDWCTQHIAHIQTHAKYANSCSNVAT